MKMKLIACMCAAGLMSCAFGQQSVYSEYVWLGETEVSNTGNCEYVTPWGANVQPSKSETFTAKPPVGYKMGEWLASTSGSRTGRSGLSGTGVTTATYKWEYAQDGFFDLGVRFDPISYTLAYNGGNGSSGSMDYEVHSYTDSFNLAKCGYHKTGYTFSGWTNALDSSAFYGDEFAVNTGHSLCATNDGGTVTLYAKWNPNDYQLTFDPNGGSCNGTSGTSSFNVTYGSTSHGFQSVDDRPGYTFNGWFTEIKGGTKVYDENGKAVQGEYWTASYDSAGTWKHEGDLTVYARWTTNTYAVTFSSDGAIDHGTASTNVTYDTKPGSIVVPSWSVGYTFVGYFTEENGNGEKYWDAEGQFVREKWDIPGNTTLYAYCDADPYYVAFDGNGCDSGEMPVQEFHFGASQALALNAFGKEGYHFAGWATNVEAAAMLNVKFSDGEVVTDFADSSCATSTLFAVWATNGYSTAFFGNGGTGTMHSVSGCLYDHGWELPSNAFVREGCTFAGWSLDPTGVVEFVDGATVSNLTGKVNGTARLYAVWSGATGGATSDLSIAVDCKNLDITTDANCPWTVLSTNDNVSGNGQVAKSGMPDNTDKNSMMELEVQGSGTLSFSYKTGFASGTANYFTFDLDDGVGLTTLFEKYESTAGWEELSYSKTTQGAARFRWYLSRYDDNDADYVWVDKVTWTPDSVPSTTVAVTFRLNDGTPAPDDVWTNITYMAGESFGDEVETGPQAPEFSGWYTEVSGGDKVSPGDPVPAASAALYAQWIYTVTFTNVYDGSCSVSNGLQHGANVVAPEASVIDGKKFKWWACGDKTYAAGDVIEVLESMTLVAVYTTFVEVPSIEPKVYNGSKQVADVASSDLYEVTHNDGGVNAGEYDVVIELADPSQYAWSDGAECIRTNTFTISKATCDISGAAWDYAGPFAYDGTEKVVSVVGLPDGVEAEYTGNAATDPSTNIAHVAISCTDPVNYELYGSIDDLEWFILDGGGSGGDDPAPPAEDYISGTLQVGFSSSQTLNRALYDADGNLVGMVQLKAGKINKKGKVKISASIILMDGKKVSAKAAQLYRGSDGTMSGQIVFKSPVNAMSFSMAENGDFKLSNDRYAMIDRKVGGDLSNGLAVFHAPIDPLPAVAAGFEVMEFLLPTNVTLAVTGGKKLNAGSAASIKYKKFKEDGVAWYVLVGFDEAGKPNLSSLKLTYQPKTGLFKGSFKLYATNEGTVAQGKKPTLKKYTMKVTGIMVDEGEGLRGVGTTSCSKLSGSWDVEIQ